MTSPLLPGLSAKFAVRVGSLLLKLLLFLPLPAFCQYRAVSSATIPFPFTVYGRTLPAGSYVLYRETQFVYSLRSADGSVRQAVMTYPDSAGKLPTHTKLIFRNSGANYHLDSFWVAGSRDGLRFQKTKSEQKELAAQNVPAPETVLVATIDIAPKR